MQAKERVERLEKLSITPAPTGLASLNESSTFMTSRTITATKGRSSATSACRWSGPSVWPSRARMGPASLHCWR
jgi:hypothetical protein